jgi:phage terminase large subunit-like protein
MRSIERLSFCYLVIAIVISYTVITSYQFKGGGDWKIWVNGVVDQQYIPNQGYCTGDKQSSDECAIKVIDQHGAIYGKSAEAIRSLEEMRSAAQQATEVPGREAPFRRFYLNQWGVNQAERWLDLAAWDACATTARPARGRRAFLGLDLSNTTDLSALVCLLPEDDGSYDVLVDFWCPEEGIKRRSEQDRVPYAQWVQEGYLTATPGNVIEYPFIEARMWALMAEYDVQEIGVDPWNARGWIAQWFRDNLPVVVVEQNMANLSSASKALEGLILKRQLRHGGHPVLRWCVSNAVAVYDANENVRPTKDKKKSHGRIDGVSALVTGLARAILATSGSVYDQRGLTVV